ncbi:hypothetical protein SAMN05216529_106180 [Faecalicatena contorta]|uniref:Secreted protein n=1 Tax=Faecalicatena contorta TaxID=39482 RepID=A0A315ZXZ2_9FIRM|nr:hypothetical protein A8805_106180 [Faecalicatena contorta]SUQ14488.1 hypothetical protein SAMN05216529_106180 [Faecalicatena contorta]
MRLRKNSFACMLVIAVMATSMTVFAAGESASGEVGMKQSDIQNDVQPMAGCSGWIYQYSGAPYCSIDLCPGGYYRKYQMEYYKRTCVRDNGTTYTETHQQRVFVSCSCL